jgi:CheY-like chemotaxis protein
MEGGPLVLVVDDDPTLRETAREILTDEGYSVEVAADGAAALRRLQCEARPALVLLDLMMPVVDGRSVLEEIKAAANLADLSVVVMTAADRTPETSAMPYPMLRKPFDLETLLHTVATYAPRLWDDEELPTDEDLPSLREVDGTPRVACIRCGGSASIRCPGCGEAFCRRCLDAGPDGRCEKCWRRKHP